MAPPQHAPLFPTWQYLASCSSRTHLGHTQAALAGMNNPLLELRQSFLCTCSWLLPVDRSLHAWCGRQRGVIQADQCTQHQGRCVLVDPLPGFMRQAGCSVTCSCWGQAALP